MATAATDDFCGSLGAAALGVSSVSIGTCGLALNGSGLCGLWVYAILVTSILLLLRSWWCWSLNSCCCTCGWPSWSQLHRVSLLGTCLASLYVWWCCWLCLMKNISYLAHSCLWIVSPLYLQGEVVVVVIIFYVTHGYYCDVHWYFTTFY